MKFKIGDVVVRKEKQQGSWWTSRMVKHNLPPDHPLVISEVDHEGDITFKGYFGLWSPDYFDLVETPKYKLEDFL